MGNALNGVNGFHHCNIRDHGKPDPDAICLQRTEEAELRFLRGFCDMGHTLSRLFFQELYFDNLRRVHDTDAPFCGRRPVHSGVDACHGSDQQEQIDRKCLKEETWQLY